MAFWVILLVAVVNVGLGFAAAVVLARRYQRCIVSALDSSFPSRPLGPDDLSGLEAALAGPPVPDAPPAPDAPLAEAAVDPEDAEPPADQAPESLPPETAEPDHAPDAGSPPDAGPLPVERLLRSAEEYDARLNTLDGQLRAADATPDWSVVQSCAESLRQVNEEYVQSQSAAYHEFREAHQDLGELRGGCEGVEAAVEAQKAQLQATAEILKNLDFQTRPKESCSETLSQACGLLAANDTLRDALGAAAVELARGQRRAAHGDERPPKDQLTGLLTRAGLEAELESLRRDRQDARQPCLAMLDLDQFGQINARHGHEVGNRILRAVARLLAVESGTRHVAARFSGQRLAMLWPDADIRTATGLVEQVRQTIETSAFRHGDSDIQVTVSCGVTLFAPEEGSEILFARAASAVQEAKRYGRNRTFLHEGRYPSPVVPPTNPLQKRAITL